MSDTSAFKVPPEGPPQVEMPDILDSVRQLAAQMRQVHGAPTNPCHGWRVVLPSWIVAQAGGWDAFVEQFEASHERQGLHGLGVIGFEVHKSWAEPARRHTMARYKRESQ